MKRIGIDRARGGRMREEWWLRTSERMLVCSCLGVWLILDVAFRCLLLTYMNQESFQLHSVRIVVCSLSLFLSLCVCVWLSALKTQLKVYHSPAKSNDAHLRLLCESVSDERTRSPFISMGNGMPRIIIANNSNNTNLNELCNLFKKKGKRRKILETQASSRLLSLSVSLCLKSVCAARTFIFKISLCVKYSMIFGTEGEHERERERECTAILVAGWLIEPHDPCRFSIDANVRFLTCCWR